MNLHVARCLVDDYGRPCPFLQMNVADNGYSCSWISDEIGEHVIARRRKTKNMSRRLELLALPLAHRKIGKACPAPLSLRPCAHERLVGTLDITATSARDLLSAVLLQAVKDYFANDAETYIFARPVPGDVFSFEFICNLIGVPPARARKALVSLKAAGSAPDFGGMMRRLKAMRWDEDARA